MELNVVTGNLSRESMYPNRRFSGLLEHSSHTCCPLVTPIIKYSRMSIPVPSCGAFFS